MTVLIFCYGLPYGDTLKMHNFSLDWCSSATYFVQVYHRDAVYLSGIKFTQKVHDMQQFQEKKHHCFSSMAHIEMTTCLKPHQVFNREISVCNGYDVIFACVIP